MKITKPKAYLFFNGEELEPLRAEVERGNRWEHTGGFDTVRMAYVAAQSWQRAGFDIARLSTRPAFEGEGFKFKGKLLPHIEWYPIQRWDFWFKALPILTRAGEAGAWFFTIDSVLVSASADFLEQARAAAKAEHDADCMTLMQQHVSLCAFWCNDDFAHQMIALCYDYDAGRLPMLAMPYVSDETLARLYGKHIHNFPIGYYQHEVEATNPWVGMVHYTRAALRWFDSIPLA